MTDDHLDERLEPDPRFPDRPDTLDFARLSSILNAQDAIADMLGFDEALDVDLKSLQYAARNRIQASLITGAMTGMPPEAIIEMLYIDAFQLGVGFQKRGGHRPEEPAQAGEGSSS